MWNEVFLFPLTSGRLTHARFSILFLHLQFITITAILPTQIYCTYIILYKEYELHSVTDICIYMSIQWLCDACVLGCVCVIGGDYLVKPKTYWREKVQIALDSLKSSTLPITCYTYPWKWSKLNSSLRSPFCVW